MKKAIWVSLATFCSTSLDEKINPHDCEKIAMNKLLVQAGYEVWLVEPFKVKARQSSYPLTLSLEEAMDQQWDLILFNSPGKASDQVLGGPWNSPRVEMVCDFLLQNKEKVLISIMDPRPDFVNVLNGWTPKRFHRLYDLLHSAQVLAPAPGLIKDTGRTIIAEYWKLLEWTPMPFNPNPIYSTVYVGVKKQTPHRRKLLQKWFDGATNAFTAGPINIKGVKSLSDFKPIEVAEAMDLSFKSKTSFLCGERQHTWLTPRSIQALICGSIASIDPEFAAMSCISSELRDLLSCDACVKFDDELHCKEVYDKQVAFVSTLKETAKPLAV